MGLQIKSVSRQERQPPVWVNPPRQRSGYRPLPYWSKSKRSYWKKPRLYVHVDQESSAENFAYREDRPVRAYRKLLPDALAQLGLPVETKARWDKRAGCACPCSPGFVLDLKQGLQPFDIWLTLESAPEAKLNAAGNGARVKNRAKVIIKEIEQIEDFRLGQAVAAGAVPLGPRSRPSGLGSDASEPAELIHENCTRVRASLVPSLPDALPLAEGCV
jgi:hypothetical protein